MFFVWICREKTVLHRNIEQLQTELQEVKDKCEDLRAAKQEAVRELLTLQDQHRDEVRMIQADLQVCMKVRENFILIYKIVFFFFQLCFIIIFHLINLILF